jgi:hypothetical protein
MCDAPVEEEATFCPLCGFEFTPPHEDEPASLDSPGQGEQTPKMPRRHPLLLALLYVITIAVWVAASGLSILALIGGIFWASVIRGVYVWIQGRRGRGRPFWSPWLFVLAAVLAAGTFAGNRMRENQATDKSAVEQRIAQPGADVTPKQRCIAKGLDQIASATPEQRATIPSTINVRVFMAQMCARAEQDGSLKATGDIFVSDAFETEFCVEAVMANVRQLPVAQRAFSMSDSRIYGERLCEEAVRRNLIRGSLVSPKRQREIAALQLQVVNELLASGKIKRLP